MKYDWCHTGTQNAHASYLTMSDALRATGRPIVFSLCDWGRSQPWTWARDIGNLWRTTGDIYDAWDGVDHYHNGMMTIVDLVADLASYAGPGHWNDPDMLEVGNGGMTDTEYRTHFSLWAMLAAPLIAGNDLAAMSPRRVPYSPTAKSSQSSRIRSASRAADYRDKENRRSGSSI